MEKKHVVEEMRVWRSRHIKTNSTRISGPSRIHSKDENQLLQKNPRQIEGFRLSP